MKFYLIKYEDSADPMPARQMWRTSEAEAKALTKALRKDNFGIVGIESVEVPVDKKQLLEWLNNNCYLR